MATVNTTHLSSESLRGVVSACPEGFAAVDRDLRVLEWNPAAELLTGYRRADVLGGPLPHLTDSQREELRSVLDRFDDWSKEVPVVLPRRHADGHIIEVCISGYLRLVDADGAFAGYGSFFRAARPTDPRTHVRNVFTRNLAESLRLDQALDAIGLAVRELLPAEVGHFLRRIGSRWVGQVSTDELHEIAQTLEVIDPDVLDEVAATGVGRHATFGMSGGDLEAFVVRAGPESAGTLMALVGPEVARITPDAAEMARAIATEGWAAMSRVEALSELEGKVEILEAIAGVARATSMQHEEMVNHVATHAARALSCERAAVYLWDTERTELRLEAFHSSDRQWAPGDEIHAEGRRAAAEMFSAVEPFLAQDTRACPWLSGPWDHEAGAVSVYGMPLSVGDHELGLLVVAHTTANPRGFTSLCTQVGEALSGQAALAISNTVLMDAQHRVNQRLEEVNRRRADYVEGITHDLRTPVTAILGFAKTLRRSAHRLNPDDHAEALATIERQALRITRMLNDMMDTARADAGELHPDRLTAVPLHHVVSEAMLVAPPEQRSRLSAVCDPTVVAVGDADQLTRVVQNLITNALRYAGGDRLIDVRVERDGDDAVLAVVDHGQGIPQGLDPFGRFSRGDSRGTGLGLYTVKTMVEAHNGTIALTETPGGGTTVTVRLPAVDGP